MWANIASLTSEKVPLTMLLKGGGRNMNINKIIKKNTTGDKTSRFHHITHRGYTHSEEMSLGEILGT